MKKKILFALIFFSLLFYAIAEKRNALIPNFSGSGEVFEVNKFHLPSGIVSEVRERYPDGLVPYPLKAGEKAYLSSYLKKGGYVIELVEAPIESYKKTNTDLKVVKSYEDKITVSHNSFLKKFSSLSDKNKIRREYSGIFNGFSVKDLSEEELIRISNLPEVKRIYPVKEYHLLLSESVSMIGATDVWDTFDADGYAVTGKNITIAVIDTGVDYTHSDLGGCSSTQTINGTVSSYALDSPHPYTDDFTQTWTITKAGYTKIGVHFKSLVTEVGYDYVEILDASGSVVKEYTGDKNDTWSPSVNGSTIKIRLTTDYSVTKYGFSIDKVVNGSVDTGLQNCSKIISGYDYVNEDDDPLDDQGHGTHCAGIAAGNGALKGVAPDATIIAYKVLDDSGSGYEDDIIAAIENATARGADVISLSLGGSGDPDDALSTAVDNAVDAGTIVVVAAGNDGPYNETVASPGCARKALTVGAIYKTGDDSRGVLSKLYAYNWTSNKMDETESLALINSKTTTGQITGLLMNASLGRAQDFSGGNFNGKIALILRGNITFSEKVQNAYEAGAVGAIIYNSYPGNFKGALENLSYIPAISISQSDGEGFLARLINESVRVNISVSLEPNLIADFSSRGPVYMFNKPDILAPGVNICSAKASLSYAEVTCLDDCHVSYSGTSMATPHVAGAAALMKQKHPTWSALQIKAAFKNTAKDYGYEKNTQGAGEINVSKAVALTSPPPIALITNIAGVTYEEK